MIGAAKTLFEQLPVDDISETNQGMSHVNQLLQIYLKQFPLWLLRLALGLHRFSPVFKTSATPSGEILEQERHVSSGFVGVLLAFQDRLSSFRKCPFDLDLDLLPSPPRIQTL